MRFFCPQSVAKTNVCRDPPALSGEPKEIAWLPSAYHTGMAYPLGRGRSASGDENGGWRGSRRGAIGAAEKRRVSQYGGQGTDKRRHTAREALARRILALARTLSGAVQIAQSKVETQPTA
ncbi:hypothetical protein NMD70_02475 [Edwardsiella tarda]|uniref:hypothetical protein n=1 Tax=Edwardsiella tarda TaxID=636 RepID=UPI00351CA2F6